LRDQNRDLATGLIERGKHFGAIHIFRRPGQAIEGGVERFLLPLYFIKEPRNYQLIRDQARGACRNRSRIVNSDDGGGGQKRYYNRESDDQHA
jgi:hypothetical protein